MPSAIMNTYTRLPVVFERGEGAWLWDQSGKRYLDALSGIAVCGLGHAHPEVRDALCRQAGLLLHTSNLYNIPLQEQLAESLTRLSRMDRVFFCNSGAEANEAAIKIARRHGHRHGIEIPTIVVMENSFHGRTLATLSATGNPRVQVGFEPLTQGFVRIPYDDLTSLGRIAADRPDVAAVLVEPIQGEGGVQIPDRGYLAGIRSICDEHGWLMMLDEIQTGMARTGALFACRRAQVQPDVMTLAKALGNGVPIGACLAHGAAAEAMGPGDHGSTFGGNPLACSAANTVLEIIERDGLAQRAAETGGQMLDALRRGLADLEGVVDIRGAGLMLGIELDRPCAGLVGQALDQGLLINVTAENTIRLLPPLIITAQEAARITDTVTGLVRAFVAAGK